MSAGRDRRFFRALALAVAACLAAPAAGAHRPEVPARTPAEAVAADPRDGPDVDLRIRIDDGGVTFQVIMNLAFIDEVVDVPREDDWSLHEAEFPGVRSALFEHYRETNAVKIDGFDVAPVDAGFDADPGDANMLPLFPRMGGRAVFKVRLILRYPAKTPPRRVSMVWGTYPIDIVSTTPFETPTIRVTAHLTAGGVESIVIFTEAEPEYVWHATDTSPEARFVPVPEALPPEMIDVPVLSAGLIAALLLGLIVARLLPVWPRIRLGAWLAAPVVLAVAALSLDVAVVEVESPFGPSVQLPDEAQALAVFVPLHGNIYRAFDYAEESQIYDALARSVDGELLDSLYNQIYRSLILQEHGGAVCSVTQVTPIENSVEEIGVLPGTETASFRVLARWQVEGTVYHWGHSHSRTNEYRARYTVVGRDAGWRIAATEILEQFRVRASPDVPVGAPAGPPDSQLKDY